MKKKSINTSNKLWIIPAAIILINLLTAVLGFINQTGVVGTLVGGTAAFMTDPVIIIFSILVGVFASKSNFIQWLLVFVGSSIIFVVIMHIVFKSPFMIIAFCRFDAVMIIASLIYLVKYNFVK